ncbi:MAG: undecaprenyl-diphosphatase UppP [Deltaproteobacteria bacterium]|nr:undecaprenyl-diphosphatase UppP [Deltaproteobacteria bacterium]
MEWWQAAVLGLVQGLTEFIPISSTAHLRIVPALLGWKDPGVAFSAVIQLGTLGAMLIYFYKDILRLSIGAVRLPFNPPPQVRQDGRLAWMIAAGNVPIVVLGLAFKHPIETSARSLFLIGFMLIAVALLLAWAEKSAAQKLKTDQLGFWQVMGVGLFQALALIPGASRSGSTILGGLLLGMVRADAARFSFLLGIPAILGAGLFELKDLIESWGTNGDGLGLALGLGMALISGYLSIGFLLRYLTTHSTLMFVRYRLVLGGAIILLAGMGMIQ